MRKTLPVLLAGCMLAGCSMVTLPETDDFIDKDASRACPEDGKIDQLRVDGQLCRIAKLQQAHIRDARNLQYERAAYNLTTLAAALVGAGGILYDAHKDLIAGTALVAGGVQTLNLTGAPAEKQKLLLHANQRLECVSLEARAYEHPEVARFVGDAVDTVERALLVQWIDSTTTVDYSSVIDNVTKRIGTPEGENLVGTGKELTEDELTEIAKKIATCATK